MHQCICFISDLTETCNFIFNFPQTTIIYVKILIDFEMILLCTLRLFFLLKEPILVSRFSVVKNQSNTLNFLAIIQWNQFKYNAYPKKSLFLENTFHQMTLIIQKDLLESSCSCFCWADRWTMKSNISEDFFSSRMEYQSNIMKSTEAFNIRM